ncbi:MAG: indole-3-glycerol phosphate synthase TrpC [Planctomycetes bacterium]|nr:indole-3-glycerol phosphate synthase TrpC [Planctomycetota bacterium]
MPVTVSEIWRLEKARLAALLRNSAALRALEREAARREPMHFAEALRGGGLIAEFKRASPSRGAIRLKADPAEVARVYARSGARAVSVLTQPAGFRGSLDDLRAVRAAIRLPILRKDFICDPIQILEARAAGADAVLLIAAYLPGAGLKRLWRAAAAAGLDALVEVHTRAEADRAAALGATLIGVNNRNLSTLRVDPRICERLIRHVPEDAVRVAESGVRTATEVRTLRRMGYDAVLVGEALMKSRHPAVLATSLGSQARANPTLP